MITERMKLEQKEDLKKYNLVILKGIKPLKNNLKTILKEKGLNQSDLSELTGICRQNISEIVQGKMTPGVVLASQIATVLGVSIETLFELTPDAWVRIAKVNNDVSLYYDEYNIEIISNSIRKAEIKKDGLEYFLIKENRCISSKEYQKLKTDFINNRCDSKRIKWDLKVKLLNEFDNICTERYKKLGEIITPLSPRKEP